MTKLVLSDMCKILSLLVVWQTVCAVVSFNSVIEGNDLVKWSRFTLMSWWLSISTFRSFWDFLFSGRKPDFLIEVAKKTYKKCYSWNVLWILKFIPQMWHFNFFVSHTVYLTLSTLALQTSWPSTLYHMITIEKLDWSNKMSQFSSNLSNCIEEKNRVPVIDIKSKFWKIS